VSSTFATSGTASTVSPIDCNSVGNGISGITKKSERNLQITLPQLSSRDDANSINAARDDTNALKSDIEQEND
jgi:hypothetical protein